MSGGRPPFAIVPGDDIDRLLPLPGSAVKLYLLLRRHRRADGSARLGFRRIVELTGWSNSTIEAARNRLVDTGLLIAHTPKRGSATTYLLPTTVPENRDSTVPVDRDTHRPEESGHPPSRPTGTVTPEPSRLNGVHRPGQSGRVSSSQSGSLPAGPAADALRSLGVSVRKVRELDDGGLLDAWNEPGAVERKYRELQSRRQPGGVGVLVTAIEQGDQPPPLTREDIDQLYRERARLCRKAFGTLPEDEANRRMRKKNDEQGYWDFDAAQVAVGEEVLRERGEELPPIPEQLGSTGSFVPYDRR